MSGVFLIRLFLIPLHLRVIKTYRNLKKSLPLKKLNTISLEKNFTLKCMNAIVSVEQCFKLIFK